MRVGIDAREICDRPAGKGQYLLRILSQWKKQKPFFLVLYIEKGHKIPEILISKDVEVVEVEGGLLFHWRVSRRLKTDKITVFFAALSYLSAIVNPIPTITVIHDLAIFRLKGFRHNRKAQFIERFSLRHCVKKSVHLIAVSQSTKRDVMEIGRAPEAKISIVYEAALLVDLVKSPLSFKERGKFFLLVSTLEPRKNIITVMRAYANLSQSIKDEYALILAGKIGWGGENYPELAKELGIVSRVTFTGYVSDEDVKKLFAEATAFLFPSFYEGFGLPVIEAMMSGTPPIVSNNSSLPEVVGDDGLMCEPTDYKKITKYIERLISDEDFYNSYSNKMFMRSKHFQWPKIALELSEIVSRYK